MRARLAALALAALLVFGARGASANGRFPASNAVVFAPGDEETVVVRVTFGLLVSRDRARSWRWICERAIGFSGLEDPSYVVTRSGAMVAGLFDGLRVSRDGGCTWGPVVTDARVFVDLTLRSDGAILALSSSYDRHSDAGSVYRSQLFVSTDDARTWQSLGARLDPTLLAESVEVAPSDPDRLYVSAVRGADAQRRGVMLVSTDRGVHWTERALVLGPKELAPFIAAVDTTKSDRVFVRTSASPDGGTRLLVSDDAARTYRTLLDAKGPLRGFALAADGATLSVGGPDDGLYVGGVSVDGGALTRTASLKVQCLSRKGDVLWACSNEASGFVVGTSTGASGLSEAGEMAFAPRLHLRDIEGPLACGADSSVARDCGVDWQKLKSDIGIDDVAAAPGAAPSGAARAAPTKAPEVHSFDLVRSAAGWVLGVLAVLVVGVAVVRSRSRRRRR